MADPINGEEAKGERPKKVPLTKSEIAARKRRLALLLSQIDAMPNVDHRSADEILDYNKHGHIDDSQ